MSKQAMRHLSVNIKAFKYRKNVGELAFPIFICALEKADDIRVDYMSDALKLDDLMDRSILAAKIFISKLGEIRDITDIDNTNAERVGEAGEPTDRPA